MKYLVVDVPDEYSGKVIDLVTQRKGELHVMETKGEMQHLEFDIPSRGLIGLRSNMLTNTAGEAVMAHGSVNTSPGRDQYPEEIMAYYFLKIRNARQHTQLINYRIAEDFLWIREKKYIKGRSLLNILNQAILLSMQLKQKN